MEEPRRRYDPAAVVVNLAAIAVFVGAAGYLAVSVWKDASAPKPPPPVAAKPAPPAPRVVARPAPPPRPVVAKPAPPRAEVAKPPVRRGFELVDIRPRKEKIDYDPGEAYGYVVVGDAAFDRLGMLRDRLTAQAGHQLDGKRVEVQQLLTWHVRTPQARLVEAGPGLPPMTPEEMWQLPDLRKFRYWVICDVAVLVEGRRASGRGAQGFDARADFAASHQRALLRAIDGVAARL